jgi:hypothetical protein
VRYRLLFITALLLLMIGWLSGLTYTGRGQLTIALAVVLVALLLAHRATGGGFMARMLAEYAVVATLAILLATTGTIRPAPAHHSPAAPAHRTRAAEVAPPSTDQLGAARDWLIGLWQRASAEADRRLTPPSTTTTHRRNSR